MGVEALPGPSFWPIVQQSISHFMTMNKRLLMLGVLRSQEFHGYSLVDYLKNHVTGGAAIGKSNAYRLLASLEADGLIRSHREREGRRPERFVYEVTHKGERQFQSWLTEALAEDPGADQPGIAELNFLGSIEPEVAARQLQKRREQVAERCRVLEELPEDVRPLHPAMELGQLQAEVELAWLDQKIAELRKEAVDAA